MWNEEDYHFDKRLIERNIDKGYIDRDDVEEHLGQLDDVSDNADTIEAEFEVDVLADDEEETEEESTEEDES
jgi:hypothetical protein